MAEAEKFADKVSYPVLVRPSYVLSGAAMSVIWSREDLKDRLESAAAVSPDHPVVITKYYVGAEEIDIDAVASAGNLILHAVSSHVEQAGVHSGDATLVLPPVGLDSQTMSRLKEIAEKLGKAFQITGPFNMQIVKAGDALKVIECNIRASRSFPFSSKVLGTNFVEAATRALVAQDVPAPRDLMTIERDYVATKVAQFSWTRLAGADPYLGVEVGFLLGCRVPLQDHTNLNLTDELHGRNRLFWQGPCRSLLGFYTITEQLLCTLSRQWSPPWRRSY